MDPDLVPEMLQGASGTTVDIQYRPNGSTAPVDLTIEREKIKLPPFLTDLSSATVRATSS